MAAYGAGGQGGQDRGGEASTTSTGLYKNVVGAGRQRPQVPADLHVGKGDVLLGYENEAIFAQQNGQPIDYVVPTRRS